MKANTSINIYDDGKLGRGVKANVLKSEGHRLLIEYFDESPLEGDELWRTLWFKKVRKECGGVYECESQNMWFFMERETDTFKEEYKEYLVPEYWEFLFGETKDEQ